MKLGQEGSRDGHCHDVCLSSATCFPTATNWIGRASFPEMSHLIIQRSSFFAGNVRFFWRTQGKPRGQDTTVSQTKIMSSLVS